MQIDNNKIIITGCARSGSSFICEVLRYSGLDFIHEHRFGNHGIVSWGYFDSDKKARHFSSLPEQSLQKSQYKKILQIRDPQKSCNSMDSFICRKDSRGFSSWEYIQDIIPEVNSTNCRKEKAVIYWILWNYKLLKYIDDFYWLHQSYKHYEIICNNFGVKPISLDLYNNWENKKINTRPKTQKEFNHQKYIPKNLYKEYDYIMNKEAET